MNAELASHIAEDTTRSTPAEAPAPAPKKRRGFAAMDQAAVREIARKGGLAAHARGKAHRFTQDEAREAGRKGGRAAHEIRTAAKAAAKATATQNDNNTSH
jgi:general stress protein YciG